MSRHFSFFLVVQCLGALLLVNAIQADEKEDRKAFDTLKTSDWKEAFTDSGASDWTKDQGNQLLEKLKQQTTGGVTQGVVDKFKWPRKTPKNADTITTSASSSLSASL